MNLPRALFRFLSCAWAVYGTVLYITRSGDAVEPLLIAIVCAILVLGEEEK